VAVITSSQMAQAKYDDRVTSFHTLTSPADLEAVWAASDSAPIILFKHSQSCGVSLLARDRLVDGELPASVHEVVVQRQRALADAVASTLAVRHESPQVIIVVGRRAVWHSSHAGVRPERVRQAWLDAAASFTLSQAR